MVARKRQANGATVLEGLPHNTTVLGYRGGKSYLAKYLVPLLPPHARYLETHFGGGSVFFAKPPAPYEVVNDLDRNVTTFFQCLRDQPTDLIAQLWATPYSREEFTTALQEADNLSPLEAARVFFIQQNQGFSGKATTEGNWGVGQDVSREMAQQPAKWQTKITLLAGAAERLRNTMIEHQDAARVIARYATPETLLYCDPPYLPETRTGTDYRHEMTAADHERLLRVLTTTDAMVALSGYDSEMYRDMLTGLAPDHLGRIGA
jgi:DNA adenine methylase